MMFNIINDQHQILEQLKQRNLFVELKENVINDLNYLSFLRQCADQELTPDIILLSYESACRENQYLSENYPKLAKNIWMFARTGQGDEWFLDRQTLAVLFYDHDVGEYSQLHQFQSIHIHFLQFLQFGLLMKELDLIVDQGEVSEQAFSKFKASVDQIHPLLFDLYPYHYY